MKFVKRLSNRNLVKLVLLHLSMAILYSYDVYAGKGKPEVTITKTTIDGPHTRFKTRQTALKADKAPNKEP
jgi:hypothetical protein